MDLRSPTHSASEQEDSFITSENERLGSAVSNPDSEVMSQANPTESVQTLPRGLVRDMISRYSVNSADGKEACRTKPHPLVLLSPDAPTPAECKVKRFIIKTPKLHEDPKCAMQLGESNNEKRRLENADTTHVDSQGVNREQDTYRSRTTIEKTDQGIRITIDIFFDQDVATSAITSGSHVVTHSPESRIINEFKEFIAGTHRDEDKQGNAN